MAERETAHWQCRTILRKYTADIDAYRSQYGCVFGDEAFAIAEVPYEEREINGNCLLDEGIEELWKLAIGATATPFSNANARIGVGDSSAAAVRTQTDLQAETNTLYKAMDATYPQVSAAVDHKVTFRASFGATEANFAWEEWSVDNGAGINLNRKVESLGTKSSGTWQLTVEISLS